MLLDIGAFGDTSSSYVQRLEKTFEEFSLWRKHWKIHSSQKRFSAKSLIRPATYGWYLNCKGFNARVVSEFLMDKLTEVTSVPEFRALDSRLDLTETALNLVCTIVFVATVQLLRSKLYKVQTLREKDIKDRLDPEICCSICLLLAHISQNEPWRSACSRAMIFNHGITS